MIDTIGNKNRNMKKNRKTTIKIVAAILISAIALDKKMIERWWQIMLQYVRNSFNVS